MWKTNCNTITSIRGGGGLRGSLWPTVIRLGDCSSAYEKVPIFNRPSTSTMMKRHHSRPGFPRPVREIIRDTYLHGFENPLLNTAGERYKEGRRGGRRAGHNMVRRWVVGDGWKWRGWETWGISLGEDTGGLEWEISEEGTWWLTSYCNPFTFCPAQLCEGPVFPTTIHCAMVPLCPPNSLHSQTCRALNRKKTQDRLSVVSFLLLNNISYFHATKAAVKAPHASPHWWDVTLGHNYNSESRNGKKVLTSYGEAANNKNSDYIGKTPHLAQISITSNSLKYSPNPSRHMSFDRPWPGT